MAIVMAWLLFALGVGHIAYGLLAFKKPLVEAMLDGYVGEFKAPEVRRTAFWFVIFGTLLMLAGQVAVHAVANHDSSLLRLVGFYALGTSAAGLLAFPKSPFLLAFPVAASIVAVSYGWLA